MISSSSFALSNLLYSRPTCISSSFHVGRNCIGLRLLRTRPRTLWLAVKKGWCNRGRRWSRSRPWRRLAFWFCR